MNKHRKVGKLNAAKIIHIDVIFRLHTNTGYDIIIVVVDGDIDEGIVYTS